MGNGDQHKLINVLTIRRIVGFLAFLLPIVVAIGGPLLSECSGLQNSISDYYHTIMRNYFVGTLCAVAVVLFAYKGYERKDDIAGDLAAFLVLLVAFFPTPPDAPIAGCILEPEGFQHWFGYVHLGAASLFFLTLSYFSIKLFTKTDPNKPMTDGKRHRNMIYRWCGYIMIGCMVLLIPFFAIPVLDEYRAQFKVVFVLEFVMLWAFGVSWLTKGEIIFEDKE